MASNVDMSLDEMTQEKRWKRPAQFTSKNKPYSYLFSQRLSVKARLGQPQQGTSKAATAQAISDLRDVLAQKQKSAITDLRAKIMPKEAQMQQTQGQGKVAQPRIKPAPAMIQSRAKSLQASQFKPGQPRGGGQGKNKAGPKKPMMSSTPSVGHARSRATSSSSPDEDSYVQNGGQPDNKKARNSSPPHRPPSYEDTKKITVTISGLNKPLSEPYPHRREERLAAAITRSREARQQSYMRNRDEFVASTITSAFAVDRAEREREPAGLRGRVYSRSPSPIAHMALEPQLGRGGSSLSRPKAYTTLTTLFISNLSDTVSRNDVAELCQAVGPLEAVYMAAPGVAEVIFKYKDDALEAYRKYNQRNLDGQPMICRIQPASRGRMTSSTAGTYGSRLALSEPFAAADLYPTPHHSGYF